jgi:hypothetical protein
LKNIRISKQFKVEKMFEKVEEMKTEKNKIKRREKKVDPKTPENNPEKLSRKNKKPRTGPDPEAETCGQSEQTRSRGRSIEIALFPTPNFHVVKQKT